MADPTWGADEVFADLRKRIRALTAGQTLSGSTVTALGNEVAGFEQARATALLPGYLRSISSDQAKADTLMGYLPNPGTQLEALRFLHRHQDRFEDIEAMLHFGSSRRGETPNASVRAARRKWTFESLIRGTIDIRAR